MSSRSALSQIALPTPPTASGEAATKDYVDTTALPATARGAANGVAPLDSGLLVPIAYLPATGPTDYPNAVGDFNNPGTSVLLSRSDHTHNGVPTDAKGAANGVATLDAATKVPIAQLPTGTTAGTVAAGDDARFADIAALQSLVDPSPTDTMMYGDGLSSMPRRSGTNMATLDNGYYTMSAVIAPKSFTATKIRFYVAQAGATGGSPSLALRVYGGQASPYSTLASPALVVANLTSVGLKELALGVSLNVVAGQRYIFLSYIPAGAFTTSPGLAFSATYYSGLNNPLPFIYNGYKTAAAAPPATISPDDGTWTGNPSTLWWALVA